MSLSRLTRFKNALRNLFSKDKRTPRMLIPVSTAAAVGGAVMFQHDDYHGAISLMSKNDINAQIGAQARAIPVNRGIIHSYHSNQFQANDPHIEDTFAVQTQLQAANGALFGVFDGHSGGGASLFAKEELLQYCEHHKLKEISTNLVSKEAFVDADDAFLSISAQSGRFDQAGACVVVTHVNEHEIVTGSAGDCRAVVGRRSWVVDEKTGDKKAVYKPFDLTHEHQIDKNFFERQRLLREHPNEWDVLKRDRVKGRLQPTRGLGDGMYKRMDIFLRRDSRITNGYKSWTVPYTTAEPDITRHAISPDDAFLVLSSDGLYQDLDAASVVEYVGEFLHNPQLQADMRNNASAYLTKQALQAASESAIGRRTVTLSGVGGAENLNLSFILQLPPSKKRNYHDDITVLVVFFDHTKGNNTFEKEDALPAQSGWFGTKSIVPASYPQLQAIRSTRSTL